MENTAKVKWLVYTVLIGLIPAISRALVYFLTKENSVDLFSAPDFIAFGFVLHVSVINEIEHIYNEDRSWKTVFNGLSIVFIVFYSLLLTCTVIHEANQSLINKVALVYCSMGLAAVSLFISLGVFYRLEKIHPQRTDK